jgi:hypothetical protein
MAIQGKHYPDLEHRNMFRRLQNIFQLCGTISLEADQFAKQQVRPLLTFVHIIVRPE